MITLMHIESELNDDAHTITSSGGLRQGKWVAHRHRETQKK